MSRISVSRPNEAAATLKVLDGGGLVKVIMQWTTYGTRPIKESAVISTSHVCHWKLTERHGELLWSWYWTREGRRSLFYLVVSATPKSFSTDIGVMFFMTIDKIIQFVISVH